MRRASGYAPGTLPSFRHLLTDRTGAAPRLAASLSLAVAAASALWSPDAGAFCRTTTVKSPAGYNPAQNGCWTSGTPLAWPPQESIAYEIAASATPQISLADVTSVAAESFGAWNVAPCAGGVPNVQTYAGTPADDATVAADCGLDGPNATCGPTQHDTHHLIVFQTDGTKFEDPVNTLGLTTVTYGVQTGTIFDADMEINATKPLTVQENGQLYDLRVIMTHEAGHFLGLAHATDPHSIMYFQYQPGAVKLTQDDIDGICTVYPPQSSGCGCKLAPGLDGGPGPAGPLALPLVGLAGLAVLGRRRLRARRGPIDTHR
jgi:hypothetical protein